MSHLNHLPTLYGKTSLVTGASSGLGADFARELARMGSNLVLVARREEHLNKLQTEIVATWPVQVQVVPADLSVVNAPLELYNQLQTSGITVDILINNAGFGKYGKFQETAWESDMDMLEINILALVQLSKLFVNDMLARRYGHILQVSSIGAFQPSPTYAVYAATKSFVLSFGVALNHELRGTGVSSTVVCPGVTATEFLQVAGQKPTLYQRLMMMRSPEVARAGLRAMLARRPVIVPGPINTLFACLLRMIPGSWAAALADRAMTIG